MRISDVIKTIEDFAPLSLQEPYDNSGVQIGSNLHDECTGILLAVDPTPAVIAEAKKLNCNLIITHHPLLFKGLEPVMDFSPLKSRG